MKRMIALFFSMALLLTACNLQGEQTANQSDISTAAALTVQSALLAETPLATPTLPLPADSPQPEFTPTFSQPMASVGEDAVNCRTGPGINYERITSIKKGESVKIVGFFPPNFWVVSSSAGDCWMSGEFTTPSGNLDTVPTVTLPPTPEGGIPAAPTFPEGGWEYFCDDAGHLEVTLSWNDNAVNETGYRVYRDNTLVIEFPADTTQFYEMIPVSAGQVVTYAVIVHNEMGEASSKSIAVSCQ